MKLLRALFRRKAVEAEMAEEIQTHVRARTEHLIHSGLQPDEAGRRARLEFGSLEKYKEECRESLGIRLFDELKADLRYALRSMRHNKAFTAVIVGCLALGIGANTAIFSVINAVLLNALPVKDPNRLLLLSYFNNKPIPDGVRGSGVGYGSMSLPYGIFEQASRSKATLSHLEISGILGYAPLGLNSESSDVVAGSGNINRLGPLTFEVRTVRSPQTFIPVIRDAVHSVDPRLPLIHVTTQTAVIGRNLQNEHALADLCTLFGALALLLSSIGLYGNLSYAVARRTNEIGIRMARGANRAAVLWMILRESVLLVAIGIAVGLPLTLAASRLLQSTLYGVRFFSPAIFAAAILVLTSVAILATLFPARRAVSIDPLTALRYE